IPTLIIRSTPANARGCRRAATTPYRLKSRLAGGFSVRPRCRSSLRELRGAPRLVEADFLSLDFSRVASHQPGLREHRLQRRIVFDQRAREPMPDRAGLPGLAAPVDVYLDVEGREVVGQHERLPDDHAARLAPEELVDRLVVDDEAALPGPDEDARDGALAPAGAVMILADHQLNSRVFGCCATCGCSAPA